MAEVGGDSGVGRAVGGASEAIDPYDLLDPVDVLSQMPKDFFTRIVSGDIHVQSCTCTMYTCMYIVRVNC